MSQEREWLADPWGNRWLAEQRELAERKPNLCGLCLLCGQGIESAADFVPGTSTHNCEAGRQSEQVSGRETVE